MKALGDRPDHTEPRRIGYKKDGKEREIKFGGSVIIITNDETCPAAFASRVFCLEYNPTDEQIQSLMLDLARKGSDRWKMSPSECLEVTEFLVQASSDSEFRLDLRDQTKGAQRLRPVAVHKVLGPLEGPDSFHAPAEDHRVETPSPQAGVSCIPPGA